MISALVASVGVSCFGGIEREFMAPARPWFLLYLRAPDIAPTAIDRAVLTFLQAADPWPDPVSTELQRSPLAFFDALSGATAATNVDYDGNLRVDVGLELPPASASLLGGFGGGDWVLGSVEHGVWHVPSPTFTIRLEVYKGTLLLGRGEVTAPHLFDGLVNRDPQSWYVNATCLPERTADCRPKAAARAPAQVRP